MDHFFPLFFSFFSFFQFGSVAEQGNNLAHIPQNFDLELYAEHRLQKVRLVWYVWSPHVAAFSVTAPGSSLEAPPPAGH